MASVDTCSGAVVSRGCAKNCSGCVANGCDFAFLSKNSFAQYQNKLPELCQMNFLSKKFAIGFATYAFSSIATMAGAQGPVFAAVIRIPASDFKPGSGIITFSEIPYGTVNPVYSASNYGGLPGDPTVTFGGFFSGQSLGVGCGGSPTGCVTGNPTNPLTTDPGSPAVFIVNDGSNPTSPVLSGTPTFNGPISILFSTDIAGVGLDAGYFNAIGGTAIKAYDRTGNLLGTVSNEGLGLEFLGLVTDDGKNNIAGLEFTLVGAEPAGFAIDNVRFGTTEFIESQNAPAPLPLFGTAAAFGFSRKLRSRIKTAQS